MAVGALLTMGSRVFLSSSTARAADATPTVDAPATDDSEWVAYGRDPGGMRHSPLTQIIRENVQDLTVAWTYHTGELASYEGNSLAESAAFEATPLKVDGALYLSTATNRVIALDAGTRAERWVFDPQIDLTRDYAEVTSRDVSTWVDPEKAAADMRYRRLYLCTLDGRLLALDADSGRPSAGFGQAGAVAPGHGGSAGLPRSREEVGHWIHLTNSPGTG